MLKQDLADAVAAGDHRSVVITCRLSLLAFPEQLWWRRPLMTSSLELGELDEADQCIELLEHIPDHPMLLSRLALSHEKAGRQLDAIEAWLGLLRVRPESVQAVRGLLRCNSFLGRHSEVIELAKNAAADPEGGTFWKGPLGLALEETDVAEADRFYRSLLDDEESATLGFQGLCRMAFNEARWRDLLQLCTESEPLCCGHFWWSNARTKALAELELADETPRVETISFGGNHFVIKRTSQDRIDQERWVLNLVGSAGLPVPETFNPADVGRASLSPLLVMERVDGFHLSDIDDPDYDVLDRGYFAIGRFLGELHTILLETGFGAKPRPTDAAAGGTSGEQFVANSVQWITTRLAQCGHSEIATRLRIVCSQLDKCEWSLPVLCHGDLHLGNVLFSDVGNGIVLSGVIDFESAIAAEPWLDLGRALAYADESGRPEFQQSLVRGYEYNGSLVNLQRSRLFKALHLSSMHVAAEANRVVKHRSLPDLIDQTLDDLARSLGAEN